MLCTHIEGNLNDPSFELALRRRLGGAFTTDEVLLDWDECRRRVIRKVSEADAMLAFAWETQRSTSPLQTATCWDASRM